MDAPPLRRAGLQRDPILASPEPHGPTGSRRRVTAAGQHWERAALGKSRAAVCRGWTRPPCHASPAAPDKPRFNRVTARHGVHHPACTGDGGQRRATGDGKSPLGNPAVALQAVAKDRAGRFRRWLQPLLGGRRKGRKEQSSALWLISNAGSSVGCC